MKRLKFAIILLLISSQMIFSQTLQPTIETNQLTGDRSLLYYYTDPPIVYQGDESATLTIEVATSGQNISRVHIVNPIQTELYDDGTHGDRVSGDGIYTINEVSHRTAYSNMGFGGTHTIRGHFNLKIEKTDGSQEEEWLRIGIVSQDQQFVTVELGDGLSATEFAFFIVDTIGQSFGITDWPLGIIRCGDEHFEATQKLYSALPDDFDFVIVMPAHSIYNPQNFSENVPYFVRAKNEIQHIGVTLFDNTAQFGSTGRLMGMIYHTWGYGAILDHEIGHSWCADIGQSLNLCRTEASYGNHWNPYSDIGGQMSAFLFDSNISSGAGRLKYNGDETWRLERDPGDSTLYSMLDLYVMGLIPPQEVPPAHILHNPDLTDYMRITADQVDTCMIEEIIAAEGGERIPSYADSPKEFNIAFIVVKNKEFTAAEFAFYSLVSKYFASEEQGELSLTTFYTATGGRARLNPHLPVETSVPGFESANPGFILRQNYPNPFNPSTQINYSLPKSTHVKLKIYNLQGQEIKTLVNKFQTAGIKSVVWNGLDEQSHKVSSGIYIYQIKTSDLIKSKKMILVQ
ncbi:MAG: T9SS type A sorting domain-containing protein [Methanosarcinaceae archaeon]